MKKKLFLSLIAVVIVLSVAVACFAGCNETNDNNTPGGGSSSLVLEPSKDKKIDFTGKGAAASSATSVTATLDTTLAAAIDHSSDEDFALYDSVFGDYYTYYVAAKALTDTDAKYAAMAVAEAKFLESGAFVPTTSQGGQYAIGRVAYGTAAPTGWGNDSDRLHNLVLTKEIIKTADREALKAKYVELKGTGTYEAYAKAYLKSKGYTLKDTYIKGYSADPRTWDITNTYRASDAEAIINTFDNLVEYDCEGRIMGALATDYTVSNDGLKYTFKIREGVYWVDQDGREMYEVTANDWVYGMKRILENGMTSSLLYGVIANATEYGEGETDDFSTVGVKALDKYTLEYTLTAPSSFFITRFIYNPFAPVCQDYAESTEGYGTAPDKILYCGPYIVTNYTKDNKIVFTANEKYWNKDYVNLKTITWLSYKENKDVTATYNDMKAGTIDSAGLNATTIELAKTQNMWDYVYVSGTDCTTFSFFYNIDRGGYETIEGYGMASSKTDDQKAASKKALLNKNFRLAIARGLDRAAYNAQDVGEDCKLYSLQNSFVPGTFVQLTKDVTIAINGVNKTFKKGTYYGEIIQAQLDADLGAKAMKVWDPTLDGGMGSSAGFDGWYNADLAIEYLNAAITELAAEGLTIDAENPIVIDYPYYNYETYANRANALKLAFNELFGGKIVLNIIGTEDMYGWYYAGYFTEAGEENNYDLYDCSGWGPDYGDPSTYLDTMMPVNGDMIKMSGLY